MSKSPQSQGLSAPPAASSSFSILIRQSRESGNPSLPRAPWIPAFAGMTVKGSHAYFFVPLCGLGKAMMIPAKAGMTEVGRLFSL